MIARMTRVSALGLAAFLALAACERTQHLVAPDAPKPVTAVLGSSGRLLQGDDGEGLVTSAVIGRTGGELVIDQHKLIVPRDAVDRNTVFTMELLDPQYMAVKLTATRDGINVGPLGFAKTLTLQMSFQKATESFDPAKLVVFYVLPDGSLLPVKTDVNPKGNTVRAYLDHFSQYAIGMM